MKVLSHLLRVPLILSQYAEKSHAEIGAILRCSAKAAEVTICRARQQLRVSLANVLDEQTRRETQDGRLKD